jgi:hypothetical protein
MGLQKLLNRGQKKINKAEQEAKQKAYTDFITEYKALAEKHKLDIKAIIEATENGIIPRLKIIEVPDKIEAKEETKAEEVKSEG